jgi:hypothetical protein
MSTWPNFFQKITQPHLLKNKRAETCLKKSPNCNPNYSLSLNPFVPLYRYSQPPQAYIRIQGQPYISLLLPLTHETSTPKLKKWESLGEEDLDLQIEGGSKQWSWICNGRNHGTGTAKARARAQACWAVAGPLDVITFTSTLRVTILVTLTVQWILILVFHNIFTAQNLIADENIKLKLIFNIFKFMTN